MRKKFQQGGVGVFDPLNLPSPEVGGIAPTQGVAAPVMQPVEIAALANLAQDADRRRREYETKRLREQQTLDTAKRQFLTLADGLVGEVHNEYQKSILDAAKQKYQIADNMMETMNLDSLPALQQETNKLYRFWHDPDVVKVLGQVEAANKYMDKLPVNMTPEEMAKYQEAKQAYESFTMDDYKQYGKDFDIRLLDGRMYQMAATPAEKQSKPQNFYPTTRQMMKDGAVGIDWDDDAAVTEFADAIANGWWLTNGQEAIDEGLVEFDSIGVPKATEKGKVLAVQQGKFLNQGYEAQRSDKLEDREAGKKIDSRYRAPSSGGGAGTDPAMKAANDQAVLDGWHQIMDYEDMRKAFAVMDPFAYPALYDYLLSLIPAISRKTGEPGGKQVITIDSNTKEKIFNSLTQLYDNLVAQQKSSTSAQPAQSTQSSKFSSPTLTPTTGTKTPTATKPGKVSWVPDGKGNLIRVETQQ